MLHFAALRSALLRWDCSFTFGQFLQRTPYDIDFLVSLLVNSYTNLYDKRGQATWYLITYVRHIPELEQNCFCWPKAPKNIISSTPCVASHWNALMSCYSSGVFGYIVNYIFPRSHKKKFSDPNSGGNPLYEKNDLIIMFVFIVLLGSRLIIQKVPTDLPVLIFMKVKH